ncbi:MAG: hypothetical protein IKD18_05035 [Clostridia bacterium]|nr:hypothetical protein [Clostridia bacterium]
MERSVELSRFTNVSASEGALLRHLTNQLTLAGFEPNIVLDCISVEVKGRNSTSGIAVFAPLDVPGLIALCTENGIAHLEKTGEFNFQLKDGMRLLGEDGKGCKLRINKSDDSDLFIMKKHVQVGDVFRVDPELRSEDGMLSGYYAANFAMIDLLSSLMDFVRSNGAGFDTHFYYTASFYSKAAREQNLIRRAPVEVALLIGAVESNERIPLVLVRDGAAFSDSEELDRLLQCAEKREIGIKKMVTEKAVTKAEKVQNTEGVKTISIALPYSTEENGKASVCSEAVCALIRLLTEYLK